jgi:hypothetical protein
MRKPYRLKIKKITPDNITGKYLRLLIAIIALSIIYFFLPFLHRYIPGSRQLRESANKEEVDVNAFFYSEESRSAGSSRSIGEKMKGSFKKEKNSF